VLRRHRTLWTAILIVAGCTGATQWKLACGCISASGAAGMELGVTTYLEDGSIDPNLIVTKLHEHLERRTEITSTLVAVRAIGAMHDHVCYKHDNSLVRCLYWFWYSKSARRGIQVDIEGDYFSPSKDEWISYRYVEEEAAQ
jgi:hypothetical protein